MSGTRVQRMFGLTVRSDRPIPFTIETEGLPDVDVITGELPDFYVEPEERIARAGDRISIKYDDGTRIAIARDAIWMTWEAPLNFDDAATYLAGGGFAMLMRLRGAACLHASAIAEGEYVTAFVGPSGSGKSTAAAARVLAGATLIAEDVLALIADGGVRAVPSYAGIRLWPEAGELLRGSRDAFAPISPTWDKRIVTAADRFASESRPIDALVFLGDRDATLTPAEGTMRLVANSYRPELLDAEMRRTEFAIFAELAASVPMRLVTAHSRELAEAQTHV